MENLASADISAAPAPSTVLDTDSQTLPSGGGIPRALGDDNAPSLRDTIADAVKEDAKQADAKPDADGKGDEADKDKPAKEAQPRENGKFAAKDKPADAATDAKEAKADAAEAKAEQPEARTDERKANGEHRPQPPARFLPDSKEAWKNVPRAVQRDVETLVRDHEAEITRYREAGTRYDEIRHYDEHVRANGGTLAQSLARVVEIENAMQTNPLQALQRILIDAGPRKADGTPFSLMEVARFVVQGGPEAYQRAMQPAPQHQQQQPNAEVEALKNQIARMEKQQVISTVIEPFRASHPRYAELEGDIAFFLQSGRIPASLSRHDRLAAAYDMAERINPPSHDETASDRGPASASRVDDSNGAKSIKSAPGSVSPDFEPERSGSIRDTLADELRRYSRSRS